MHSGPLCRHCGLSSYSFSWRSAITRGVAPSFFYLPIMEQCSILPLVSRWADIARHVERILLQAMSWLHRHLIRCAQHRGHLGKPSIEQAETSIVGDRLRGARKLGGCRS